VAVLYEIGLTDIRR